MNFGKKSIAVLLFVALFISVSSTDVEEDGAMEGRIRAKRQWGYSGYSGYGNGYGNGYGSGYYGGYGNGYRGYYGNGYSGYGGYGSYYGK